MVRQFLHLSLDPHDYDVKLAGIYKLPDPWLMLEVEEEYDRVVLNEEWMHEEIDRSRFELDRQQVICWLGLIAGAIEQHWADIKDAHELGLDDCPDDDQDY